MPSYRVSETAFYEAFPPDRYEYSQRTEQAISQLVRRYGIAGKSILSLASGTATEEFHFLRHGNRLTLVDFDVYKRLEPVLRSAPAGNLHYIIENAATVELTETFDLFYLSSLDPDEFRRDRIVRQRDTGDFKRMLAENDGIWEWPWWEEPFHPWVIRFAGYVKPGGLMIVQSYAGGCDVTDNRYFVGACERQLASIGMSLIELYQRTPSTGVLLYVIAKGDPGPLPLFPPLTSFHGRAAPERIQCLRLYGPPADR